ncbi:hypothetical protein [Roseovarius sp. 2305UL8-3]|uniref:hypothetical protein n=1 Tax=Roseovarius conchicola TaxID=3121636 RepID=UPI003528CF4F
MPPLDRRADNRSTLHFCITHKELDIPLQDHLILLEIGDRGSVPSAGGNKVINCYDELPGARVHRKKLGAMLGVFAARHYLCRAFEELDFSVSLSTYRTCMMHERNEENFMTGIQMNLVTPEQASRLTGKMIQPDTSSKWLLPQPITVPSVGAQYAKAHHLEDLEVYLSIAIEENVLADHELTPFLESKTLLPGCFGVSLMPAQVFCDVGEKLERVANRFLEGFSVSNRDSYQIRAVDFCSERLGSFLIAKHLTRVYGTLPKEFFGYWTRVSADLVCTSGHMSD